jgi:hypothetical protein
MQSQRIRGIELRDTGYVTHTIDVRYDGEYDRTVEVKTYKGKLYSVKLPTAGKIAELDVHDIKVLLEILKLFPLE